MFVTCQNVSLGYEGRPVIEDLSFAVESGDYLWVVGENGSGKTTLIKGMLRLLAPLKGSIDFCEELARGKIGYLPQQAALKKDFPAGAYEIVLSGNLGGMGLRPFYSSKEKKRAEEVMLHLGIANLKGKCYRELSGGQQRRILLARALCAVQAETPRRSLLVLDEPAASLDPLVTVEVYNLLKTLNEQAGITLIMVSHDTQAAALYANRILHLEAGRGYYGTTKEYLESEQGKNFFGHRQ